MIPRGPLENRSIVGHAATGRRATWAGAGTGFAGVILVLRPQGQGLGVGETGGELLGGGNKTGGGAVDLIDKLSVLGSTLS